MSEYLQVALLPECTRKVQSGTSRHLAGSSDLAYKMETVTELCTKKHDVSLGGDVTARLNRQTDRQTCNSTLAPLLHHVPSGFICFLILSLCFFLFYLQFFSVSLPLFSIHLSSIPLNPSSLSLRISFSCRFFSPHSYFPPFTLLFSPVSTLIFQFTSLARLEYF